MKSVWKWVIGIVVILIVIASVICAHAYFNDRMLGVRNFRSFESMPHMNGQFNGYDGHFGMMKPGYMNSYPHYRTGPSFFRGLFPLVVLGLLLYGAYHLGTRNFGKAEKVSMAGSDSKDTGLKDAEPAVLELTCGKCGQGVQEDWRNCPHCGKRQ